MVVAEHKLGNILKRNFAHLKMLNLIKYNHKYSKIKQTKHEESLVIKFKNILLKIQLVIET